MKTTFTLSILATALAGLSTAHAASSASAQITGLTYTLYDLNPTDGIQASITFLSNGLSLSFAQSSATDPATGSQSGQSWNYTLWGPAASGSAVGSTSAQASISGAVAAGGVTLDSHGSTPGSAFFSPYGYVYGSSFSAQAAVGQLYSSIQFQLSPYTLIVFSATTTLNATTTVGQQASPYYPNYETASASAYLQVSGAGPANTGTQSSSVGMSVDAFYDSVYDPVTGNYHVTGQTRSVTDVAIAASFTNYSSSALAGSFSATTSANGFSAVSPVPEAGTWALMLAGLSALGVRARRRG